MDEKTGKVKKFNSMVDAMNFMGELGWEFVQAYLATFVLPFLIMRKKNKRY